MRRINVLPSIVKQEGGNAYGFCHGGPTTNLIDSGNINSDLAKIVELHRGILPDTVWFGGSPATDAVIGSLNLLLKPRPHEKNTAHFSYVIPENVSNWHSDAWLDAIP